MVRSSHPSVAAGSSYGSPVGSGRVSGGCVTPDTNWRRTGLETVPQRVSRPFLRQIDARVIPNDGASRFDSGRTLCSGRSSVGWSLQ